MAYQSHLLYIQPAAAHSSSLKKGARLAGWRRIRSVSVGIEDGEDLIDWFGSGTWQLWLEMGIDVNKEESTCWDERREWIPEPPLRMKKAGDMMFTAPPWSYGTHLLIPATDTPEHTVPSRRCGDPGLRLSNLALCIHMFLTWKTSSKRKESWISRGNLIKKGETPNPCIACNKYMKFHGMLIKALSFEMDYIATGHYARVVYDKQKGEIPS